MFIIESKTNFCGSLNGFQHPVYRNLNTFFDVLVFNALAANLLVGHYFSQILVSA